MAQMDAGRESLRDSYTAKVEAISGSGAVLASAQVVFTPDEQEKLYLLCLDVFAEWRREAGEGHGEVMGEPKEITE